MGLAALTAPAADPPKADAARIAKLVKQLGSDSPDEREKATKELEEIGEPAADALRAAQLELRRAPHADPLDWAAFVYVVRSR